MVSDGFTQREVGTDDPSVTKMPVCPPPVVRGLSRTTPPSFLDFRCRESIPGEARVSQRGAFGLRSRSGS
jgi:hypothetical protein